MLMKIRKNQQKICKKLSSMIGAFLYELTFKNHNKNEIYFVNSNVKLSFALK